MELIRQYRAPQANAPVMVLFGGNPERMNEVVSIIRDELKTVTAIGNFSEEEGLERLGTLKKVDLVLIGGRYSEQQRIRIRKYVNDHFPGVSTTEPGNQYPYDNAEILKDIRVKLNLHWKEGTSSIFRWEGSIDDYQQFNKKLKTVEWKSEA